eukprot:1162566-Pleurochrysis_carterae.AAC.1
MQAGTAQMAPSTRFADVAIALDAEAPEPAPAAPVAAEDDFGDIEEIDREEEHEAALTAAASAPAAAAPASSDELPKPSELPPKPME